MLIAHPDFPRAVLCRLGCAVLAWGNQFGGADFGCTVFYKSALGNPEISMLRKNHSKMVLFRFAKTENIGEKMIKTYRTGVIPAGGVAIENVGGWGAPFTATINSTAAGRQIAFSTSPTGTPEPVTPDVAATGWINFGFLAPVCLIRFTGNPGDTYEVR